MARIPEKIGKYRITELLAKGGMGDVYKGIHPTLKRHVILKKLTLRGDSSITNRFKREAQIMIDFKNENIVNVYDHFKEGASYYIVLEYINGMSLDKLLEKHERIPDYPAMMIFLDVCRALKYAHDKNVIHRDIKPGNILISRNGEIKLADFGIASSEDHGDSDLTMDGTTLGTPAYMAPEQFDNSKNVDKRADIYSMGVMLYEMITGIKPFPGNFSAETIAVIQKGKYKSAKKVKPSISPVLNRIIKRCMQRNKSKRYQDMDQLIRLLEKWLSRVPLIELKGTIAKAVQGKEFPPFNFIPKHLKRIKAASAAAAFIILAVSISLIYFSGYWTEILQPDKYGSFILQARVKKGFKSADETFINASIFRDDSKRIPKVENISFKFRHENEDAEYMVFKTSKKYLKSGFYRAKINIENKIFWQSFYLDPLSVQKERVSGEKEYFRIIETSLDKIPPLPLTVISSIRDSITGKDLSKTVSAEVQPGRKWLPLNEKTAAELETDKVYKFKFEQEDYYPAVYSLRIAPYQTILYISADLVPFPGKLEISSDTKGLKILINGKDSYMSGGKNKALLKTGRTSDSIRVFDLPPGKHKITVKKGSAAEKSVIDVKPGKIYRLAAEYDDEKREITIKDR